MSFPFFAMKPLTFLASALAVSACVPVTTTELNLTPVKPIEVRLAVSPEIAFDRTVAAFIAEGYKVDQANKDAGTIRSVGALGDITSSSGLFGMGEVQVSQAERFFRANIVRTEGGGSIVYLSSSARTRELNGQVTPETEMYECPSNSSMPGMGSALAKCREGMGKWKAQIESLAAKVRGTP